MISEWRKLYTVWPTFYDKGTGGPYSEDTADV